MSAVLKAREPSARYLTEMRPPLVEHFDFLASAPGGVTRLRELILTIAVRGKLVPQDRSDEPASALLERIHASKLKRTNDGGRRSDRDRLPSPKYTAGVPHGWVSANFGDVADISGGVTLGRRSLLVDPVVLPYLRVANVQRWHLQLDELKEVAISKTELERFSLRTGDLLITEGGDWDKVGRTTVWRGELAKCLHQNHVFKARGVLDSWNPEWAQLYLNSPVARAYFASCSKQTTNLASMNMTQLKACPFPLPPVAEQYRIVARFQELMRLCDALEVKGRLEAEQHARLLSTLLGTLTDSRSPEELAANWQRVAAHFDLLLDRPEAVDSLEQAFIQLAVCGRLVPQQPNEEPASTLLGRIRSMLAIEKANSGRPAGVDFQLPGSWEWARIDSLADVQGGIQKTPLRRPVKNHYPYLRVANVQRDALELQEIERFELTDDELKKWRLCAADILIVEGNGSENEVGRCAVWNGTVDPCVYQNHLIRVRCPEVACIPFIQLFLNSASGRAEMKRLAITTSGLFNLSVGKIRSFVVPVPPLAEQRRIVARVNQLRLLCADLRQRLADQQTTQARLAEALVESATAS